MRGCSSRGLNILAVDDDIQCLSALRDLLAADGHRTITATRGWEAISLAQSLRGEDRNLQLSILDVNVPDLTGPETFQRLSALVPGIGAIFISGESSRGLEAVVRRIGGFALVPKPLDVTRFRRVVSEFHERFSRA